MTTGPALLSQPESKGSPIRVENSPSVQQPVGPGNPCSVKIADPRLCPGQTLRKVGKPPSGNWERYFVLSVAIAVGKKARLAGRG